MRHEWNEARRAVEASAMPGRSLRIGMQNDLAASHIGDWVSQFRQALPDTAFYVELDYSTQMSNDVLTGELDLAVLYSPRHLPDLHFEMVGEVAYRMVSTDASSLRQVTRDRYILANYSPAFSKAHERLLPEYSHAPIATGQNAAMCGLISTLGGSAYVLDELARDLVGSGQCRLVIDAEPIMQPVFFAVHVRNRHKHRKALAIVKRHFAVCEAFYIPLHFSEIAFRNAMQRQLLARAGPIWFAEESFVQLLDPRFASELSYAVNAERKQHGAALTSHHVVSALTFGFWEHLLTKRFERYLWAKGISLSFPNAPKGMTNRDVHTLVESLRRWRNRIAHHHAIFDRGPMRKHADALCLLEWICSDTYKWVASISRVPSAISLRPKL